MTNAKNYGIDLNELFKKQENTLLAGNFLGIEEHYQIDWDFGTDQDVIDKCMKEDGFVYKCIADNRSSRQQHMDFGFFAGRNIVERIFKCLPFGHLASDVITVFYPESGLSPNDQSRFVWMCTKHPDWHMVKELRIVTRCPYMVSDCKSEFCRIIGESHYISGIKDAEFKNIEGRDKFNDQRITAYRPDMEYKDEKISLIYLWGAKERRCILWLCEDNDQVYWCDVLDPKKIYRSTHYNMWYEANALWCNTLTYDDIVAHATSGKPMDDFVMTIVEDLSIPDAVLQNEINNAKNKTTK